jgi:hypothetical protein
MTAIDEDFILAIQQALRPREVAAAEARTLAMAAAPLWDAMAELGMADSFGGMERRRVLPDALAYIIRKANWSPGRAAAEASSTSMLTRYLGSLARRPRDDEDDQ